jgi:hypothetical protein
MKLRNCRGCRWELGSYERLTCVSVRFGLLLSLISHLAAALGDLTIAGTTRHGTPRAFFVRMHGSHGKRIGVVTIVQLNPLACLLDAKDTDCTC